MDIGTGIAVAGIWMLPAVSAASKNVTTGGWYLSVIVAAVMTAALVT